MIRFRYRLSWLLLVPVALAGAVWWFKPPTQRSYDYLSENKDGTLQALGFYHVKHVYLDRQLLLSEIKDCDYAIVFVGADWSPTAKVNIQCLFQASKHYRGRLPFFICHYAEQNGEEWFSGLLAGKPGADSFLGIVQHGMITHQYFDYLGTPEDIHALLKQILPWNYQL